MSQKTALNKHSLNYLGHTIVIKEDFGDSFFLIDGMPCNFGFVVIKNGCNVIPGAGWFQTVKEAKLGIDCLIRSEGDAQRFHEFYRKVKEAQSKAVEELL